MNEVKLIINQCVDCAINYYQPPHRVAMVYCYVNPLKPKGIMNGIKLVINQCAEYIIVCAYIVPD